MPPKDEKRNISWNKIFAFFHFRIRRKEEKRRKEPGLIHMFLVISFPIPQPPPFSPLLTNPIKNQVGAQGSNGVTLHPFNSYPSSFSLQFLFARVFREKSFPMSASKIHEHSPSPIFMLKFRFHDAEKAQRGAKRFNTPPIRNAHTNKKGTRRRKVILFSSTHIHIRGGGPWFGKIKLPMGYSATPNAKDDDDEKRLPICLEKVLVRKSPIPLFPACKTMLWKMISESL